MNVSYTDQMAKQEQYRDLLCEAEHYRRAKAVARPGPSYLQKVAAALRQAMVGPARNLPRLGPVEWRRG